MSRPTDFEQEMLELINRARTNPAGEYDALVGAMQENSDIAGALRFFGTDLGAFRQQIADIPAQAPVAWNTALATAAKTHTALMIDADTQSHRLPGEAGLLDRVKEADYTNLRAVGENIYAYTKSPAFGHYGFFADWGYDDEDFDGNSLRSDWQTRGDGIQDPAGHRNIILSATYTEIGISAVAEKNPATQVGPYVVTQNFGTRSDYAPQLVGVVLSDGDGDRFYDAGEGLGGITVTVSNDEGTQTTTTWDSGGYQITLDPGTYTVTFAGGTLNGVISETITMGTRNLKLDGFAADATAPADATETGLTVTGDAENNTLTGNAGDDTLIGQGGDDILVPGAGNDDIRGGAGQDMVTFFDHEQAVSVDLEAGTARSGSDVNTLMEIENITGSIFGDFLWGDAGDNRIRALGNYDWMVGSDGADYYDGGGGRDMISYVYAPGAVEVDLGAGVGRAGQAAGDRYVSVERATGSIHPDLFFGGDGNEDFRGLGGYDWFYGSGGRDRYDGGSGLDTVSYALATEGVIASLLLGYGSDGDAAGDLYTAIERLTGSSFDDILTGDHGRNQLRGMYGEDTLLGNGGIDRLTGGGSDDYLDGGAGFDYALYSQNRADYTITPGSVGVMVSYNGGGGEGTDTLFNIEALQFADDMVFL